MGLDILRAIQSISSPALDVLFNFLSMFGESVVLAAVFCGVYWCVDKAMGRYLIAALCTSLSLNGIIKDYFNAARPIGEAGIISQRVESATGHSFPSGHSQSAAVFWWGIALWLRKSWGYVVFGLLMLGVGFSRLYLGLHYPIDVVGGILFGALTACLFYLILGKHSLYKVAAVIVAVLAAVALLVGESDDTICAGAMSIGLILGWLLEARLVQFKVSGSLPQKARRFGLGMALIGVVFLLPKLLLPDTLLVEAVSIALIAFVGIGGWPWVFTRLGL